jgi:hypothetical protein
MIIWQNIYENTAKTKKVGTGMMDSMTQNAKKFRIGHFEKDYNFSMHTAFTLG